MTPHPTRRRMAGFQFLVAALLLVIAAYALQSVPLDARIQIEWFGRAGRARAIEVGIWGLLIAPVIVAVLGLYARLGRDWNPEDPKARRFTWIALVFLDLILVAFQLILTTQAIHAGAA